MINDFNFRYMRNNPVFSRTNSDIQISKNRLQLRLKLHQLWRTAM